VSSPLEPSNARPAAPPAPLLGRVVAVALTALFLMVALGIFWVWQRASREQEWRRQINASEPLVPRSSP